MNDKNYLLYAGLSKDEFKKIEDDVSDDNRRNLVLCTALAAIFLAVLFVLSLFLNIAKGNKWLYFAILCVDVALYFTAKYAKLTKTWITAAVYCFWTLFLSMGIVLAMFAAPDNNTVTFIALLLVGPLLFNDKPIRVGIFIYFFAAAFVVLAIFFKNPEVLMTDVIHVILFATISVFVSFSSIKLRFQKYKFEYRAKVLSETDLLTGVKNRNAFEMNKDEFNAACKRNMYCVYLDANGLHELNNESGHKNGDEMLKKIADGLKGIFGAGNVYRMGGDEFVGFCTDVNENEIEKKLAEMREYSKNNNDIFSFGYAYQSKESLDMDKLLKTAESEMYQAKRSYYENLGKTTSRFFSEK